MSPVLSVDSKWGESGVGYVEWWVHLTSGIGEDVGDVGGSAGCLVGLVFMRHWR